MQSSSEIVVSAQLAGRVAALPKKLGDQVAQNELVVKLQDTAGTYSFAAQRANATVAQAQLSYEQTLLSLEKAIQDSQFSLQQAQNQAANASLSSQSSAAATQLESAKQSLEKATLDYENKLKSDEQTIQNYTVVGQNLLRDVQLLYETVLTDTDKLLGVSELRRYANDPYEHVLGAKDTSTKLAAEDQLRILLQERDRLHLIQPAITPYTVVPALQDLQRYARNLAPLLDKVDLMLQNTITSSLYTETTLATDKATIDALQSQVNTLLATLTTQINTIQTFFATYQDTQASLAKAVELAETAYETAESNLETAQSNARVQVNALTNTVSTTQQNKETTQKSLSNTIRQAQIAASEAGFQLSKLSAKAPVAGSITDIFVDVGQEVSPGTPLFSLSAAGDKQLEIILTQEEVASIRTGTVVTIRYDNTTSTGILSEIGTTPSVGVSYKAIVTTTATDLPAGLLVDVLIPIRSDHFVIPLNRVRLINTTQGKITLRDGRMLSEKVVSLGEVKGDQIEITDELPPQAAIVISDTKQYDPEKYDIVLKNNRPTIDNN